MKKKVLYTFKVNIFLMTVTSDGSHEKTSSTDIDTKTKPQHRSSPKKILQRLPIAFE